MIIFNEEFWRDLKKGINLFNLGEDKFVELYYANYLKELVTFSLAYMMEQAKKEGENQKFYQAIVEYFERTLADENADVNSYDMSENAIKGLELTVIDPNYIMYLEKGMESVIFKILAGIAVTVKKPEERKHVLEVFKKHEEIYAKYKKEDVAKKVSSMFNQASSSDS